MMNRRRREARARGEADLRPIPVGENPYAERLRAELLARGDVETVQRWELIEAKALVERARLIDQYAAKRGTR